jgi:hypothetical protein
MTHVPDAVSSPYDDISEFHPRLSSLAGLRPVTCQVTFLIAVIARLFHRTSSLATTAALLVRPRRRRRRLAGFWLAFPLDSAFGALTNQGL